MSPDLWRRIIPDREEPLVKLTACIERIVFRSEETAYTVLNLDAGDEGEVLAVGTFPSVSIGDYVAVEGEYVLHPKYGIQLQVENFDFAFPTDLASYEKYLSSGVFKGIGKKLAKRIVQCFGEKTFTVMEEEPERLTEVKGISLNKARDLSDQVLAKREGRRTLLYLQGLGFSPKMSMKLYKAYGAEIQGVIRSNPYRLAEEVEGIGFHTADELAEEVGIRKDSPFRIESGFLYVLRAFSLEGNTCMKREDLIRDTAKLLQIPEEDLPDYPDALAMKRKISIRSLNGECFYSLPLYYYMEQGIALMLRDRNLVQEEDEPDILETVREIEKEEEIRLADEQREAILSSAKHGILLLTGGPGTGKTTTLRSLIRYFEKHKLQILLAAPTGRAAKRMGEATGREAQTIHRLLEASGSEDGDRMRFQRDEDNPLEADILVIDEMSMVDTSLFYNLLRAVPVGCRIVLTGDENQLPSVGAGNVLRDLLSSGCFKSVRLKRIFRQEEASDIVKNAHRIREGETLPFERSRDFLLVERDEISRVLAASRTLVMEKIPDYLGITPRDVQILTPMRKGMIGVEGLNRYFQKVMNPPSPEKKEMQFGDLVFREGDKVMQTKNDYDMEWTMRTSRAGFTQTGKGIFNGDIGILKEVRKLTSELKIEFEDGREVLYPYKDVDRLEHAFALTIHKSQGSEYVAVLLPLLQGPKPLMVRRLLYTGVTRAKRLVCIVGSRDCVQSMIQNTVEAERYTGLKEEVIRANESMD